ncbi:MAG: SDR family NAD(P)-dependent oxidoreductase, partial [Anaerolineae bacterium]|nr:SDR family NAD(P)-dependent oxidoreductase [Anaerolineae bacterium]
MRFDGKVVLVTGASRGIGASIARLFAQQGAHVAVHYHGFREGAEVVAEALPGGPHMIVQADMKEPSAVAGMIAAVVDELGRIDVLVNNAGIYEEHPLAETGYQAWQASWQRVIDTNLIGPANASYCAAQEMIRQGGGRIVNVSSRGAFRGEPLG